MVFWRARARLRIASDLKTAANRELLSTLQRLPPHGGLSCKNAVLTRAIPSLGALTCSFIGRPASALARISLHDPNIRATRGM